MTEKSLYDKAEYFQNRELSWMEFNQRILGEARDKDNPLFERMKFLSITASNLDEFFMVRIASLKDMVNAGYRKRDISGMTAREQLAALNVRTHTFIEKQYTTYNRSLLPRLKENGLEIIDYEQVTSSEEEYLEEYFHRNIYPVLTPMAIDSSRPFPLIRNKTLNIAALLEHKGKKARGKGLSQASDKDRDKAGEKKNRYDIATVQVPSVLSRVIPLPALKSDQTGQGEGSEKLSEGRVRVILLEKVIEHHLDTLFLNHEIICSASYRIMRNADLPIDEDEAEDLLKEIEKQLKKRQWGEVIQFIYEDRMDKRLVKYLKKQLKVHTEDMYEVNGPLDLTFLMKCYGLPGFDHCKEAPYQPQASPALSADQDIFAQIRKGDVLLHHPYESFDPVVDFIRQAAVDEQVLAIKQTLYRVSGNSPIVAALAQAAENGKQVTVLVELKARFDEENNINWAKTLEQAGCHVIYGLVGLKTHCKIALVVRRETDGIRRYVHLGTGNYNDTTARLYTDAGMFTCRDSYGEDATAVFNMLSGYSEPARWNRLLVAPFWMKDRFLMMIRREIAHVKEGRPGRIIAKCNSLCDKEVILALYEASAQGVEIDLIIRGICCLIPGIPGVSDNIRVRSIVGTFLEHARIFYFHNGGEEEYYMGSADWMPRNLIRRVEIVFPIEDESLKKKADYILKTQLSDTMKAQCLQSDGSYQKVDRRGKQRIEAQRIFCRDAREASQKKEEVSVRRFVPGKAP
ncbi:MAG: RNA degradosome polyphosphate kinase [Eubacterium sp.]|nr:RNA degradosome polyphosphate kinase [Eubacterium sp.]